MYILESKPQLNSFVNSMREQSSEFIKFTPKPAKFKELVSRCLGFNSYADLISNLPIDMEVFKGSFPTALTKILIAEPYGDKININTVKSIYSKAMESVHTEDFSNFIDEIHNLKKARADNVNDEVTKLRKRVKDNFVSWIQQTIDNIESIKNDIRREVSLGKSEYVVLSRVFRIEAPIFSSTTTKIIAGTPPNLTIMQSRRIHGEYDYECAKSSLLTSRYDNAGFNGRWYYVDENMGKSVILDVKLVELWELLESLGLRPFFNGGMESAHLSVRF